MVGLQRLCATAAHAGLEEDDLDDILKAAGRMANEVLAPLQRKGDLQPAYLENGVVRTAPGFTEGYRAIAEGGWIGMAAGEEYGGLGLPWSLQNAVNEMINGACISLGLNPLLTQGQIDALEQHADGVTKELFLPKLISGQWAGTMNITEPQAGSDVGAIRTVAEPGSDGKYQVTGQKIFISWGDSDVSENICHLVLARLPGAVAGTQGLSLFLVPKFIPKADGKPGPRNSVRAVSLEHKLGLHGSPTAVMEFDQALGWLIGGSGNGMKAMFTMMNNARLGVGCQGVAVAESAIQQAAEFAAARTQGIPVSAGSTGVISDHADVRRMLLAAKAQVQAARYICADCAFSIDMARATGEDKWNARAGVLTPVAKAFGTDTGVEVSLQGIKIHGGMGYIEETGACQFLRDVLVTTIYEGTNGIQAIDLAGRKLADSGAAILDLLDEVLATWAELCQIDPDLAEQLEEAQIRLRETTRWMVQQEELNERFAGAVPLLRALALVLGAHYHARAFCGESGEGARAAMARIYFYRLLPGHLGLCDEAKRGATDLFAPSAESLFE